MRGIVVSLVAEVILDLPCEIIQQTGKLNLIVAGQGLLLAACYEHSYIVIQQCSQGLALI